MEYDQIGFRCGIEIHQQIEGEKLFCRCPTKIRKDKPDFKITRSLRASAGESGNIDQAAKHEQKKNKRFIYYGYEDTTCLVEADEEPPRPMNKKALETSLQIASLLHCRLSKKIMFMRKIVVDGSNTSGFQRTALIGRNGYIELNGKRIGIDSVCLEEEACQVIERKEEYDSYNLSRLGIPLIEIATSPDISSPEEAKEAAGKIGMILRSVRGIKRGIGSIRQDVNISIRGGARTEIKGFQDIKSIPKVIDAEIRRQLSLIKKGKAVVSEVRKAEPDLSTSFLRPMPGADRMYPETDVPVIETGKIKLKKVELLSDKISRISSAYSIPEEIIRVVIKKQIDIERFITGYDRIRPLFIAESFVKAPKEIKKKFGLDVEFIDYADEILSKINEGTIPKESLMPVLVSLAKGEAVDYSAYRAVDEKDIEQIVLKAISENKGANMGALMGECMKRLRGKADGKKVMELLKKNIGNK